MKVRNTRDLGLLFRDRRLRLGLSQADVASRIGASRHWVMALEAGKPTVEAGLVMNALSAVGLLLDLSPGVASQDAAVVHPDSVDGTRVATKNLPRIDLAAVLAKTRPGLGDAR